MASIPADVLGNIDLSVPPKTDAEAKQVLTLAYENIFGPGDPNLFALGIAQALGVMEGANYGKWGPNNASNNWGAITRTPNEDGSCPTDSFQHGDSSFETGEYQTCFKLYSTSLDGAEDLLRELYVNRPAAFDAASAGDIRGFAEELYRTHYYMGTAPHDQKDANSDFTNVNNYIAFIGRGVNQIADLYPQGGEVASDSSNTGVLIAVGAVAVIGLAVAMR